LGFNGFDSRDVIVGKAEKEHRAVIAEGKPYHLLAHLGVHHINQFISRTVALDLERCDLITEILLRLALFVTNELANS
jgi:hypothetical protein